MCIYSWIEEFHRVYNFILDQVFVTRQNQKIKKKLKHLFFPEDFLLFQKKTFVLFQSTKHLNLVRTIDYYTIYLTYYICFISLFLRPKNLYQYYGMVPKKFCWWILHICRQVSCPVWLFSSARKSNTKHSKQITTKISFWFIQRSYLKSQLLISDHKWKRK